MALDGTYTGLLASAADFLNRQDLTAVIPDFVVLGEAMMNRNLRVLQMHGYDTGTTSDNLVAVPTDWLETRTFRVADPTAGQQLLTYVGDEEWDELEASGLTGATRYYTIIDGAFQVLPAPSANVTYNLRYYQSIPPLVSNSTNWLLSKSPDLYLYSTLLQSAPYLKDDERIPIWSGIYNKIIEDMHVESERAMRSRVRLATIRKTYG